METPELSPELRLRTSPDSGGRGSDAAQERASADGEHAPHKANSHSNTSALDTMSRLSSTLPSDGTAHTAGSDDDSESSPRENGKLAAAANGHDAADVHRRGSWDDQQDKVKMYKTALHKYTLQHFHEFQRTVEQRSRSNSSPVKPMRNGFAT
ncbi:hypothetical protein OIV83_004387 [Microbotryomycetes sp. JL201]|nr:hypothetical protein OIV83_004387 [Microbotryomycetes sp. JL201]